MLAVGRLDGRRAQTGHVRAGKGLRDGQADALAPRQALVHDALLQRRIVGVVQHHGQPDHQSGQVAVLEPARRRPHHLLRHDHVVEVVKLAAVHGPLRAGLGRQQRHAVEVLAGAQPHVQDAGRRHLVHEILADVLAAALLLDRLGRDVAVHKLAQHALQAAVRRAKVRVLEHWRQPQRLAVGHQRQVARLRPHDARRLACDRADRQLVCVLLNHLLPVQVVERHRRVRARHLPQHKLAARVRIQKVGHVVDDGVDNKQHRRLVVGVGSRQLLGRLGDLRPRERPRGDRHGEEERRTQGRKDKRAGEQQMCLFARRDENETQDGRQYKNRNKIKRGKGGENACWHALSSKSPKGCSPAHAMAQRDGNPNANMPLRANSCLLRVSVHSGGKNASASGEWR